MTTFLLHPLLDSFGLYLLMEGGRRGRESDDTADEMGASFM
jgi:hypothetical protein